MPSASASKPFAFGAAVEIAADGRFVAVEEPQRRDDQSDRLEQQPDRQQQDQRQHDRDNRGERELPARTVRSATSPISVRKPTPKAGPPRWQ
jgi:hypothetical protein